VEAKGYEKYGSGGLKRSAMKQQAAAVGTLPWVYGVLDRKLRLPFCITSLNLI